MVITIHNNKIELSLNHNRQFDRPALFYSMRYWPDMSLDELCQAYLDYRKNGFKYTAFGMSDREVNP